MPGNVIDEAPMSAFHWRVSLLSAGGPFLDGWILSIIGIALVQAQPALGVTTLQLALIGAATFVGMFVGGLFGGFLCDLLGRKTMYTVDLIALIVGSVLCAFVDAPWQLIVLRFVIGIAVGADYPIAASLLAEFVPRRRRGMLLASLVVAWFVGSCISYVTAYLLSFLGDDAWRWMLASAAVPGVVIVILRAGIPESPRWLVSKGRTEDADRVLKGVFGPDAGVDQLEEPAPNISVRTVLARRQYVGRALFVIAFQSAQIIPLYAIYTYLPQMLTGLGFTGPNTGYAGGIISSGLILVGGAIGMRYMDRWGRRPVLIWPFIPMTLALLCLAAAPSHSMVAAIVGFSVYSLFSGVTGLLVWSYPGELFPTEVRSTAIGMITAATRIGAAVGTFLVPLAIAGVGVNFAMLVGAIITAGGLMVSIFFAPETKGRSLADTSGIGTESARPTDRQPTAAPDPKLA